MPLRRSRRERKAELRIAAATAPFLQHSPERAIAAGVDRTGQTDPLETFRPRAAGRARAMDLGPRRPGSVGRCRITAGATVTPPVRYARRTRPLSDHLAVRSLTTPTATCCSALPNSSTGRPFPTGRERKSRQRRGRPADSRGIKRDVRRRRDERPGCPGHRCLLSQGRRKSV